jgi:hypothetical protein
MADQREVDAAVDQMVDAIQQVGDDVDRFTQAQALEFYEGVLEAVRERAEVIRQEMDRG